MAFVSSSSSLLPSSSSPAVLHPCDDIWKKFDDFLLTPPQSPPVLKFPSDLNNNHHHDHHDIDMDAIDLQDIFSGEACLDLDLDLSAALDGLLEEASCLSESSLAEVLNSFSTSPETTDSVLHDCMWSGRCGLDDCTHDESSSLKCNNSNRSIRGNPLSLLQTPTPFFSTRPSSSTTMSSSVDVTSSNNLMMGSSPLLSSFCSEMLVCEDLVSGDSGTSSMGDDDSVPMIEDSEDDEECGLFVSTGSESLIDHSYGSSMLIKSNMKTYGSNKSRHASSTSSSSSSSSCRRKSSNVSSSSNSLLPGPSPSKSKKLALAQKEEMLAPVSVKFVKRKKSSVISSSSSSCKRKTASTFSTPLSSHSILPATSVSSVGRIRKKSKKLALLEKEEILTPISIKFVKTNMKTYGSNNKRPASPTSSTSSSGSCKRKNLSSASSTSSSCSSSSNSLLVGQTTTTGIVFPEKEKRREHNDSEKKRRDHLRNAFHSLRDQIPNLSEPGNRKPARIVILYEAASYVNQLEEESAELEKQKKKEMAKKTKLMNRLAQLMGRQETNE